MSAASWVIRLVQDGTEESPILVRVTRKVGGHASDLDLLATDGEAAFTAKGKNGLQGLSTLFAD
jgi:hypothetical protein